MKVEFAHVVSSFKDFDWLRISASGTLLLIGRPFVKSCIYFIKTNAGISHMDCYMEYIIV